MVETAMQAADSFLDKAAGTVSSRILSSPPMSSATSVDFRSPPRRENDTQTIPDSA